MEQLTITLTTRADRVVGAQLASTRRTSLTHGFRGQRLAAALEAVPKLFPLCGRAQQLSATRAVERSAGWRPAEGHIHARRLLLEAEALETHGRTLWVDAAPLLGRTPDVQRWADCRRANARLAAALYPGLDGLRPGAGPLRPERAAVLESLEMMRNAWVLDLPPLDLADPSEVAAWAQRRDGVGPGLLAHLTARNWTGLSIESKWAPHLEPDRIAQALAANPGRFARVPTLDGQPVQVGPLAQLDGHPQVGPIVHAWGRGLGARCWARLIAAREHFDAAIRAIEQLVPAEPFGGPAPEAGAAIGTAATARGPLFHYLQWSDHRVDTWYRIAPTEWNLHPDGVATKGPAGWPADEAELRCRHHLIALDPCVPAQVVVKDEMSSDEGLA